MPVYQSSCELRFSKGRRHNKIIDCYTNRLTIIQHIILSYIVLICSFKFVLKKYSLNYVDVLCWLINIKYTNEFNVTQRIKGFTIRQERQPINMEIVKTSKAITWSVQIGCFNSKPSTTKASLSKYRSIITYPLPSKCNV